MTPSGEELTLKGEFAQATDSRFSSANPLLISYSMNLEDRFSTEISGRGAGENDLETFQMIFVLKGNIRFESEGQTIWKKEIGTQQHNLCRIRGGSKDMVFSDSGDEVICINLTFAFLSRYLPESHKAHHQLISKVPTSAPIMLYPFNMHITPEISAILQRLGSPLKRGFCDQLLLESKVIELLALQINQFEQLERSTAPSQLKKEEIDRMQEVREILINNTGEQLSLRSLAHLVGTNEFNLKRDFKAVFGNTVYGYLNQHKMEQAKTMLIANNVTIGEISKKMGYKHPTHFTSAFKKYFGYLPKKIKSGKLSLLIFIQGFSMVSETLDSFLLK